MSVKKQIALFGGSFDPIHNGHVKLLEQVCKTFSFDEVILLPCRQSPHKATRPQATDQQRLTMCQLATSHLPKVTVNSLEIMRPLPSYSWMTVEYFQQEYPDAKLYWIMGTDQWNVLESWSRYEYLIQSLHFIIVERQEPVKNKTQTTFNTLSFNQKISSTEIRKSINECSSTKNLPKAVSDFIKENQLYL